MWRVVRRIAVVVVALMAVLLTWAAVAALRYQPLNSGNGEFRLDVTGADGRSIPNAVTRKDGIVYPSEGLAMVQALDSQVIMHFPIENDGRFSVRLTKVLSPGNQRMFAQAVVSMGNEHGGLPNRPFQPVTLKPGDNRTIEVNFRPACLDTLGPVVTFKDALIEYSFLGVHHTAEVPFQGYGYAVAGFKVCD
jgi:hypothetical protein